MDNEVLRSVDENGLKSRRELFAKMIGTLAYYGYTYNESSITSGFAMLNAANKKLYMVDPCAVSSKSLSIFYNNMAKEGITSECTDINQFEANLDMAMEKRASEVSSNVVCYTESMAGFNSLKCAQATEKGEDCFNLITNAFNYVSASFSETEATAEVGEAATQSTQILA